MLVGVLALSAGLGAGVSASDATAPRGNATVSLERLKAGNARFAGDPAVALPIDPGRRAAVLDKQTPFASVLSCADSRVPPEIVFNTGIGDLFVVRSAGEVLDRSVLASLEYGAEHLKTPLLVIMGHEFCGAVQTAVDAAAGPSASMGANLDFLIKSIQPAVARASRALFEEPLKAAVLANVEHVIGDLQTQSGILRKMVDSGELQIVGAYYELASGAVTFSQPARGRARPTTMRATSQAKPSPQP
jgi:carbonic anhydrase